MNRNVLALAITSGLLVTATACGGAGSPPQVSAVTLSRTDIRRASEFFASAMVTDEDADLEYGVVELELASLDGDTEVVSTVSINDFREGSKEVEVTVGLTLFGAADLGPYELSMTVEDEAGNVSDPSVVRLTVEQ